MAKTNRGWRLASLGGYLMILLFVVLMVTISLVFGETPDAHEFTLDEIRMARMRWR